jgi:CubicO group peptidase (beta-lactamase class C family)
MKNFKIQAFLYLFILGFCISSCVPYRALIHNIPKQKTNHIFPRATIESSKTPFIFPKNENTSIGQIQINNLAYIPKPKRLEQLLNDNQTQAFLIIRNDTIIYEKYFDKKGPETAFTSFSMAKSFVSSLLGIALKEGKISSVQEPICKYFPEIDAQKFGHITIENLLQHTSGIKFKGLGKLYYSKNIKKHIFDIDIKSPAGSEFFYENGNSQLLGILVERVFQQPIDILLKEKILQQIGTEAPFYWAYDSEKTRQFKTFCCIDARARDYARMGKLWMQNGIWEGKEIIPVSWMKTVQQPVQTQGAAINYKYQFWQSPLAYQCFSAAGMYGQLVFMCPERNLMFVRLGERSKLGKDDKFWLPIFLQILDQL